MNWIFRRNKINYLFGAIWIFATMASCKHSSSSQLITETESISNSKNCIKNIIAEDESLGKTRNHNCEKISLSETIRIYANGLEALDFAECPEKFSTAFQSHIKAWKEMIIITDKYPNLRGEMHDLFDEIEEPLLFIYLFLDTKGLGTNIVR